jgi:membrane protease YdiL (CAAX protease family)
MAVVKARRLVAALIVALAVLVVFVSPAIHLDYSALQGKQRAQVLFALITYWGAVLVAVCPFIEFLATDRLVGDLVPARDTVIFESALLC